MTAIDTLKKRWSFPTVKPNVEKKYKGNRPEGWCKPSCVSNLKLLLDDSMKVVVDGGSWMGCSASYLLEFAPNATVICIDTWKGCEILAERCKDDIPNLYNTFCVNLWDDRDRVIPIVQSSIDGMHTLYKLGIKPDLIYVDWAHDADNVERDVNTAMDLFPDTDICGDDFRWKSVKEGLTRVLQARGITLMVADDNFWRIQ